MLFQLVRIPRGDSINAPSNTPPLNLHTTLNFADMERVRDYVHARLNKAYGLLQVFKQRLLPETTADIESGPLDLSRQSLVDGPVKDTPELDNFRVVGAFGGSNGHHFEQEQAPQPKMTKGPARFITANDGSENCMALLVTKSLMAKLGDFFEDKLQLEIKSGPLEHAKIDAREIQLSLESAKESLEKAKSQERIDELENFIEQQHPKLLKACRRRDKLEEEYRRVQRSVNLSRDHTQWVLETAMREANLLKPHRTPSPELLGEDESDIGNTKSPPQGPIAPDSENDVKSPLGEAELVRRAALEELGKRSRTLDVVQAKFDNRRCAYEDNLAKFQQGLKDGVCNYSRSDFDRRGVEYGSKITRALINAEETFDQAEAYAKAVGAIDSQYGQPSGHYEESLPDDHMASYIATRDWGFVHDWLANVLDADMLQDPNSHDNPGHTDDGEWNEGQDGPDTARGSEDGDWEVPEAEIQDSASAIDYGFNRKNLDRWQQLCAQPQPDASPEAWDTWPEAMRMWPVNEVERRHSFGGYSCQSWDDGDEPI